jgi:hypothetical protein
MVKKVGKTHVMVVHEDPNRLVVVRPVISLFIEDTGATDIDEETLQRNHTGGYGSISNTSSVFLSCPNWNISKKILLSGCSADSDDFLDPEEQFEVPPRPSE